MSQTLGEGQSVSIVSPHGLDQIRATFGDIFAYVLPDHTLDPRWQTDFLQRITLPFPIPLSWDRTRSVSQVTCHKRLGSIFADTFERIQSTIWRNKSPASEAVFRFARNAPARSCQLIPGESQLI